jgi:ABC-type molybdate transport system substrate-binding protein
MLARLCAAALLTFASPAMADSLQVVGAGSLTAAFSDLLRRFPAGADTIEVPEFGPSHLMRQAIEAGRPADLFASADMEQARRLAIGRPERPVIHFTRNSLCATGRAQLGLTPANVLDRMLDPAVRLGTSTPGADPGGDYAFAVFARAEALRPGARAALEAKALKLVGGGAATPLFVPGKGAVEGVFLADKADMMLGYCSGAAAIRKEVPGLATIALPPDLTVGPAYGMVVLSAKPVALRFAAFVMSEAGQATLAAYGFQPVGLAEAAPPLRGVLVQQARKASLMERLAGLPMQTRQVTLTSSHGAQTASWTGPLLWDVLVAAGAVDPAKSADHVRQRVTVTGADGYTAAFALAEIAPGFSARPVLLADRMDNAAIPEGGLRLVVPSEARAGRSVRDVIRIDVE